MTSTTTTPTAVTGPAATTDAADAGLFSSPLRRPLSLIGGAAMIATPLLLVGAILTTPPQASRATGDYITALARDPFLTSLSSTLFHFAYVTMALGLLVAMTLVRTRKGRVLTLLGGVLGGFSAVQMSALMYNDWVLSALGNNLDLASATRVADAYMLQGDLSAQFAWKCATLSLALPVLLYAGLARAGVISWLLVPLSALPMIAPYLVMGLFGTPGATVTTSPLALVAGGVVGLVCGLPTFVVGLRLIGRSRLAKA